MRVETRSSSAQAEAVDNIRNNVIVSKKCMKMRRYRENVKKDPARLEKYREKDRERKRKKRAEQRQKIVNGNRELQERKRRDVRKYMKKYRAKAKGRKAENTSIPDIERTKIQELQKVIHSQSTKLATKRTQNWRLRVKLASKIYALPEDTENNEVTEEIGDSGDRSETVLSEKDEQTAQTKKDTSSPGYSKATIYRHVKKIKDDLPKTPEKKAAIVEKLINSPTTSKILECQGNLITEKKKKKIEFAERVIDEVSKNISESKSPGNSSKERKVGKHVLLKTAVKAIGKDFQLGCKSLGLTKKKVHNIRHDETNWWKPNPRKRRRDRISENVKQKIKDFYLSAEISRIVPNKKEVICLKTQEEKQYVQKQVMVMTSADAFHQYKRQYPEDKVGFSSFKKLKPAQVRRVSETSRKSCLCNICCNVALKADALKHFIKEIGQQIDVDKKTLSENTLCEKGIDGKYHPKCLSRQCCECGTVLLRRYLRSAEDKSKKDKLEIHWYKWDTITVDRDDGSKKKIKSCVAKTTTFSEFLTDLEKEINDYPSHKFRASWQQSQMSECLKTLDKSQLMMIMDFSENYKCSFQNEIQSAYFEQNLVTIHPCMCYYKKTLNDEEYLYKHSVIGISNDLKHDSSLVKVFEDKAVEKVEEQQKITTVTEWTDGCAAQYKSRIAFAYLSKRDRIYTRNYFETSHGKNVCDGLGAIVKNSLYRAMLTGKIIANAEDVYNHCFNCLTHGVKINEKEKIVTIREFVYLAKESISRNVPMAATITGTRKLHAIQNTGEDMIVKSKNLSCYCHGCRTADKCLNINHVDGWVMNNLTCILDNTNLNRYMYILLRLLCIICIPNMHYMNSRQKKML